MKKIIAILLAALLLMPALAACGGNGGNQAPASSPPPAAADTGSQSSPAGSGGAQTLGWYPDAYEASLNRDKYTIAFITITLSDQLHSALNVALREWAEALNCEYVSFDARADYDTLMSGIETYASNPDIDGLIIDTDVSAQARVIEICAENNAVWYPALSPFMNADQSAYISPAAVLDGYSCGRIQVDWMFDNYASELGVDPVDPSQIGYIFLDWSPHPEIHLRIQGATARYTELYPNLVSSNWIPIDVLPGSPANIEGAFDLVSAYLSTNGDNFDYWFIGSSTDEFAIGATRAVEQLGLESRTMISAIMGGSVVDEWNTGKTSAWRSLITVPLVVLSETMVCGLLAILDGRATPEELYPEFFPPGENYGIVEYPPQVFTYDNRGEYWNTVADWVAYKYA